MLDTYSSMIPLWIKEDEKFTLVYKYIESIFNQIVDTCDSIRDNLKFDINSKAFIKLLSIFGQDTVFVKKGCNRTVGLILNGSIWTIIRETQDVNIPLSKFSLYYLAKFNSVKNNFNGTFKNLEESLNKVFNVKKAEDVIENYITIECNQNIIEDEAEELPHPALELVINLNASLADKFPPYTSGPDGVYDDPEYIGYIDHIRPEWITASEENTTKYNTYKDFLELITIFENGYFSLNILGVLTTFEMADNAPVLRWGHSKWNQALWSDSSVTEEDE